MKKILFSPFLTLLPLIALAYDVKLDGIYYNISGDEAEVTSSNNNTTEYTGVVVIPESVTYHNKTYSVTSIGTSAFAKSSNLISVTIPESVTKIGGSAFLGCSSLTSVTIPESVTSIGHWAFQGCRSLTSLTIPNGLTIIDQGVFSSCTSLKSVNIPECVTSI
ncbi:MAG: leucine-rich repeat domain-containing protein, partial [Bacteroidaceae bacterium]|nr:leucine-rich repeat domain-containing protein [Bacteroidaceae bacterium]